MRLFPIFLAIVLFSRAPAQASILSSLGEEETDPFTPVDLPTIRISGGWGYSYWIGGWKDDSLTDKSKKYFRDMKFSPHYDITAEWFFLPRGSFGLMYVNFDTKAEAEN